jgi:hypothetical protein
MPPRNKRATAEGFRFSVDWFSEHAPVWDAVLRPRLAGGSSGSSSRSKGPIRALFVGAYEGRAVVWLLRDLLGDSGRPVEVTVVEDFGGRGGSGCVMDRGRPVPSPDGGSAAFVHNVRLAVEGSRGSPGSPGSPGSRTVELVRLPHAEGLLAVRTRASRNQQEKASDASYDLVYVDGRSSRQAMEAAVLAFPLVRPGTGVMILGNYVHSRDHGPSCPRRGVDGFLDAYAPELRVLRSAFHLVLERRAAPFAVPGCRSEHHEATEAVPDPPCPGSSTRKKGM